MSLPYKAIKHLTTGITAVVILTAVIFLDRMGAPQKWHAAVYGTVLPLATVVSVCHHKWARWQFWASLGICFAVHLLALWYVFDKVRPIKTMGILIWTPVMFAEGIFILGLVPLLERKLQRNKHKR
jgi:hypothetical protein